ncbi:MAG: hypothetical protein ACK5MP_14185 [Nostocoides sp.]
MTLHGVSPGMPVVAVLLGALLTLAIITWPHRGLNHPGRRRPATPGTPGAAGTRWLEWLRHRLPHGDEDRSEIQASHAEVLAVALRAGASPQAATKLATRLVPEGQPGPQALLTRAVDLSWALGAPLVPAAEVCADVARDHAAAQRRRRAALSGVRASMWLLTALPILGPVLLALGGVDVLATYTGSAAASAAAVVGALLTAAGWWGARAIIRRASRPQRWRS